MKFAHSLAAAVAIAAAFAASTASATTVSMADLSVTGLVMLKADNTPLTTALSLSGESRTASANSNSNAIMGTGIGPAAKTLTGGDTTVDVGYRCAGAGCGGLASLYTGGVENNLGAHLVAPDTNFSVADALVSGSILANIGRSGLTRADVSATADGAINIGGANATLTGSASASTIFGAGSTLTTRFSLGYDVFVAALVNTTGDATGLAGAATGWSLMLSDLTSGAVLLTWTPEQLNQGFTSVNTSQNIQYSASGTIVSSDFTLTAGHSYSLMINQSSNAVATFTDATVAVPEPASILLLALGLLALVAATRRRQH